jgi:hypothetical protein
LIRHIIREHTKEIGEGAKLTQDEFIKRSKGVHGEKYNYDKTKYVNNSTPVTIICPIHGEFEQLPKFHLRGSNCPSCSGKKKKTNDEFIEQAKLVHGTKYDYSKVDYKGTDKPVTIICPLHGEFEQTPSSHINGRGCRKCGIESTVQKQTKGKDKFIEQAKSIHGNEYNYSKVDYENNSTPVEIICPKHGPFLQRPSHHLHGSICPICSNENTAQRLLSNTGDFIKKAREVHGDKYDYSKVNYTTAITPVEITCPKHGPFLQRPAAHLSNQGCPYCSESQGESILRVIFKKNNIIFEPQKKFLDCTNETTGKRCKLLPFDFYIPSKNTCIEYDGIQHYGPYEFFGGDEGYRNLKIRDKIKNQYCKKNGIKLIRIPYTMKTADIEPYILKELGLSE